VKQKREGHRINRCSSAKGDVTLGNPTGEAGDERETYASVKVADRCVLELCYQKNCQGLGDAMTQSSAGDISMAGR
jgi:hypothetical protein